MAQQTADGEAEMEEINAPPENVDRAVQKTRHALERTFGDTAPELARGLAVMTVQQGKIIDQLANIEQEACSVREAFDDNQINATDVIQSADDLAESAEALRTAAESYQDRIDAADQKYTKMIRSDGGQQSIHLGQYVTDRDDTDDSPRRMVVLERPGVPANEYEINTGGETVAAFNRDYPADDPTIVIVYENDALDGFGTGATPDRLVENYSERAFEDRGVRTYTFPESRLQIAEDQSGIKPE